MFRGKSEKPLYVTVVGIAIDTAADYIKNMHGGYRMPTLLKQLDVFNQRGRAIIVYSTHL